LRLALPPDVVARLVPGESVTVAVAARVLGCDPSTVRKLLRGGHLAGHRVGAGDAPGGVRVDLESIEAYKARHAIGGPIDDDPDDRPAPRRRRARGNPAHDEAMAWLRSQGVLV
jgi:excisionase family DNA binding protein